ncbi:NAD(P)H-binding protein [Loktanella sp. DJP18]|uniref:NmrA family NAD(P)-binding protein n=1 Tax=Loktanella sp. DJP18 TaxID=3409788 RepID=UPI003BB6E4A2
MIDPVLVTGGTGKTGRRVAARLAAAGIDARVGTRSPQEPQHRRFDWGDLSCADAFNGCTAAWLVAPTDRADHLAVMQPMLEQAMARGVRRFVLLSSSLFGPQSPLMGEVHAWLAGHAEDWAILRPSWFMQNFTEGAHGDTIRNEGAIYSATGSGRVAFIDADDIAAAAVAALTAGKAMNADVILTGPKALSYDNIAALVSERAGRTIRHVAMEPEALSARLNALGIPPEYVDALVQLDLVIRGGAEDRTTAGVMDMTGRPPRSFRAFVTANKDMLG